jgi:RNA polymerase primary sigma factor
VIRVRGSRLSAEQERRLVVATERGDKAACRELVEAFLPAIAAVARRFPADGRVQRGELIQEGVSGLLFAARRYDTGAGTPFWAYASFWVRKAMQELVAELTRPVALSDHAVRGLARVRAARRAHVQAHGSEPTSGELAAATGFTRTQLDDLLAIDRSPQSFEAPLGSGGTLADVIADPASEREYEHVLDRLELQGVQAIADRLDERESTVLRGHYGLGQPRQTLSSLGARLGLTGERVRQIEANALEKLRQAAAAPPT